MFRPQNRRRRKRETLVGLRPPDVPRLRRQVAYFYAAHWPDFAPPLTIVDEHDLIIDYIKAHDRPLLVALMTEHAERLRRRISHFVQGDMYASLCEIVDYGFVTEENFRDGVGDLGNRNGS